MQASLWNLKICHSLIIITFTFLLLCIFQSQAHLHLSLFLPCSFFYLDQISQNRQVFPLLFKFYTVCKAYRHGQHDSLPYSVFHELVKIVQKDRDDCGADSHSKLPSVAFLSNYFLSQMTSFFMSDADSQPICNCNLSSVDTILRATFYSKHICWCFTIRS